MKENEGRRWLEWLYSKAFAYNPGDENINFEYAPNLLQMFRDIADRKRYKVYVNPCLQPDFDDPWRYRRLDFNKIVKDWELKEKELAYHKESYGPFRIDGDLATLIKNLRGDE
jgi:hypothetical protein